MSDFKTGFKNRVNATWFSTLLPNHLKVALRNMKRDPVNSFINIFGLATGIACCIILYLYVGNELSYDTFHEHQDDVYLLNYQELNRPGARFFSTTSPPMGPALQAEFPEVLHAVRLRDSQNNVFGYGDRQFYEENIFYADSTFFDVFSFPLSAGNSKTALARPNTVVLTRQAAEKYFGDEDPMGKELLMDGSRLLEVTGVLEPVPDQTHLPLNMLVSFETFRVPSGYPVTLESWRWVSFHTYLRLQDGSDPAELESKMVGFLDRHRTPRMSGDGRLLLQPVTDIYLSPEPRNDVMKYGNAGYAYGLAGTAFLILLIACVNFMNLSTAQSLKRGKEAGIRKVLGSDRKALRRKFLGESVLYSSIAFLFSAAIVLVLMEYIPGWFDMDWSLRRSDILQVFGVFAAVSLVTGLIAGLYPALIISGFNPAEVLKGKLTNRMSGARLRNILMTLQFVISVGLIVGSLVILKQMNFLQGKDLGFNKDQTIALQVIQEEFENRYRLIKERLSDNPYVMSVSGGDLFFGGQGSVPIYPEGLDREEGYPMNIFSVKYDFFETMDIEITQGRSFSESFGTDSARGVVLNRAAVDLLGWEQPIGKQIQISSNLTDGVVIGVTENFHFTSLHNPIRPLAMYISRTNQEHVVVKVKPGNLNEMLASLEADWNEIAPDMPFSYFFLDDSVEQQYRAEQNFTRMVMFFTALSIFIACLGLYGVASIGIQQKRKEIGIRKVLGGRIAHIFALVSKPYMVQVLLANVIAWPLAWWGLDQWLSNFAYRTEIGFGVFALAGGAALAVALLTVSWQSVKAALMNPVESLRNE